MLFVGEALVGNEAVDQLTKFNQALADHAGADQTSRLIDGIVLTKFDTIDDKVIVYTYNLHKTWLVHIQREILEHFCYGFYPFPIL